MGKPHNAQVDSVEYTGNTVFPSDPYRLYFFVVMLGGASGTIEFGDGGGKIPLSATDKYIEPFVTPSSKVTIESTGSYIVIATGSTHQSAT